MNLHIDNTQSHEKTGDKMTKTLKPDRKMQTFAHFLLLLQSALG